MESGERLTGCLAGAISDLPYSDGRVTTELVWWAKAKRDLIKLFDAYLYWSKYVVSASHVFSGDMTGDLKKFYSKRGFEKKEETWLLTL